MISPHRIIQQFTPTVSLVKCLLEVNHTERAKEVAKFITSAFANINQHLDTCVSCYIRLGNANWLQSLISDIFEAPVITSEANLSKKYLLGTLISSPVILELVTSSELGKSTMDMLVTNQLTLILNELSSTLQIGQQKTISDEACILEFSSCLMFVGRLERDSYIPVNKHLFLIQQIVEQLKIQQLLDLLIEFLKSNEQRSTVGKHRFLFNSLLSRMKSEEVPVMLRRESILEATQLLQSEDKLSLRSFLEQVRLCEISGSWDCKFKFELFDTLINSPGIWDGLDSISKSTILDTCTTIVSLGIVHIGQLLDSSSPEGVLISEILVCVKFFFLAEKNRFGVMTDNGNVFLHLLSKLPLSLLMRLVLDIYVFESQINIKKSHNCLVWYRDLCRLVFSGDFTAFVKKDQVENVFLCLLWVADHQLWDLFSNKVSTVVKKSFIQIYMNCLLNNVEIQQGLVDSDFAFAAFSRIVKGWTEQSNSWKEPTFTWKQPNVVVNGHPKLQAFLRSPETSMNYQNFTSVIEARRFADNLLEQSKNHSGVDGFNIAVSSIGGIHCRIAKNFRYYVKIHQTQLEMYHSFQENFDKFLELWLNLSKDHIVSDVEIVEQSVSTSEDEVLILPSTKRFRSEIDVVEIRS